jgi:hypothetical protein
MKRVLTLAATGLLATGLGFSPMSARADQAATGKSVTPAPAASVVSPDVAKTSPGTPAASTSVKKDDKVTATPGSAHAVTPGTTAPVSNGSAIKTPAKGS